MKLNNSYKQLIAFGIMVMGMSDREFVNLAERYCLHYHEGQKRKGGNQPPYATHPFEVRDILVRHGYNSPETQAIALLHDTIEDTDLEKDKEEIEKRFGEVVYNGVYILSNNTIGKHAKELSPLFLKLGIPFADERGKITPAAYKFRILTSRDSIKRIKIADMIHNTGNLRDLNLKGIERKIMDAEEFYIPLGRLVAPVMVGDLIRNISDYKESEHYIENFRSLA